MNKSTTLQYSSAYGGETLFSRSTSFKGISWSHKRFLNNLFSKIKTSRALKVTETKCIHTLVPQLPTKFIELQTVQYMYINY
jgi:hypothetical protein